MCLGADTLWSAQTGAAHAIPSTPPTPPPTGVSAALSSLRSGSAALMWVMRCGLTFEIPPPASAPQQDEVASYHISMASQGSRDGGGSGMSNKF